MGRIHGIYWSVETRIENEGKKPSKDTPRVMANPANPRGLHHALAHGFSEPAKASRNLERLLHRIDGSLLENSPHRTVHRVNRMARGNSAIQKKAMDV
jgi:hypothetical protein